MSLSLHLGHQAHISVKNFIRRDHLTSRNFTCASLSDDHLFSSLSAPLPLSSTSNSTSTFTPPSFMAPVKRELGLTKPGPSRTTRNRDSIPIRAPSLAPTVTAPNSPGSENHPTRFSSSALNDPAALSSNDIDAAASSSSDTMANDRDRDNDVDMTGEASGTPQDAMQVLAGKSGQLIQGMQKLSSLSIDAAVPSLPKFIVVGDQSAGKSSMVEGLGDIKLPRGQGTCTRVPTHITTTSAVWNNAAWTAKISLHRSYVFAPSSRGKYAKWAELGQLEVVPFATIFDKDHLEVALRRAQLALLNPKQDPESFSNLDSAKIPGHELQIGFSPNVISLEIAALGLPELSFYDLPGAINTTPSEKDSYLVVFVERLLTTYMSDEKALILLACPANQDMENSTANRYLRKCKAEKRTIGVLTKPDLMEGTQFKVDTVKAMLNGELYPLGYGWFIAKQLSHDDIVDGVDHAQAREMEKHYFNSWPWNDQLVEFAERFGIVNLQQALSRTLTQHILDALPGIVNSVNSRLQAVKKTLSAFPERSADPGIVVNTEIYKLYTNVKDELSAETTSTYREEYRQILGEVRTKFKEVRPCVDITTPGVAQPIDRSESVVVLSSEDEDEEESPSKRSKTNNGSVATPSNKRQRTPAARTPVSNSRQPKLEPAELLRQPVRTVFKLDQVQHEYDSAPGADIAGETSSVVDQKLCLQPLPEWYHVAEFMLTKIETAVRRMLASTLQASLGHLSATLLYKAARQTLLTLFKRLANEQRQAFQHRIDIETSRAVTVNKAALGSAKSAELARLQASRREHRMREYYHIIESRGLKLPTQEVMKKNAHDPDWISKNLGFDEYEREINALVLPLAYYDIASASLLDTLAKQVDFELIGGYRKELLPRLLEDLKVTDKAHCETLLAESEASERQRVSLENEMGTLEKAVTELSSLPDVHG
ncbi:unnamed protein product [Zymoseptoria tritici ST99CH_3D7]|uniref:GED domain-containing protein n=1 Tax=Zymoseptoria tritici (strain ST99CH_3D7) TaxID=1276538 RepID=A0A1X7RF49_ZYMT9|nr:unnamed protein product [Zymoseptoria tritici ST99CH_3D7]